MKDDGGADGTLKGRGTLSFLEPMTSPRFSVSERPAGFSEAPCSRSSSSSGSANPTVNHRARRASGALRAAMSKEGSAWRHAVLPGYTTAPNIQRYLYQIPYGVSVN